MSEKWQFLGGRDSTHIAFAAVLQTTFGRGKFEAGPFGPQAQRSGNCGLTFVVPCHSAYTCGFSHMAKIFGPATQSHPQA